MDDALALAKRNATNTLTVCLAVGCLIEIWVSVVPGSKLLLAAMTTGSLGALLARRRFPFGAPLAPTAIMAAGSFFVGEGLRVLALPILIAILAGWLMGYGNGRRRAVIGLVLQYACVQTVTAHFGQPGAGDVIFRSLLIGAPWLAGHTVRTRAEIGRSLEERTQQLEAAREEAARTAVAEERLRIARELHDVVAHSISVMTIQAGAARLLLDEDVERAEEPLLRVEETGRETLTEMRRLLGVLRRDMVPHGPPEARPSLEHIDSLLDQYREAGLPVELAVEGNERPLPPGLDLAAYRVVQEALTNTLKHAGGAHVAVTIAYGAESLELCVADDGNGTPAPAPAGNDSGGHGLVGMRERAAIYGGRLDAGPSPTGVSRSRPASRSNGASGDPGACLPPASLGDALVVVAFLAALAELIWHIPWGQSDDAIDLDNASRWVAIPFVALWTLPLLLRRRSGLVAGLAVFIATTALAVIDADATDSIVLFVMILVASAVIGLHEDRRRAIVGGVVALVALLVLIRVSNGVLAASDVFVGIVFALGPLAGGQVVRSITQRNLLLKVRTQELERPQAERPRLRSSRSEPGSQTSCTR